MPTWTRNVGRFRREQEAAWAMGRDEEPAHQAPAEEDAAEESETTSPPQAEEG